MPSYTPSQPQSMQDVGRFVKRSARAKQAYYRSVGSSYHPKTTTTRGASGKVRHETTDYVTSRAKAKMDMMKALKAGMFDVIARDPRAPNLKGNMIQFADAVQAPATLIAELRAMDPYKLYALMNVNTWLLDLYFSYEAEGTDYGSGRHVSHDNIRMVIRRYKELFGSNSTVQTRLVDAV